QGYIVANCGFPLARGRMTLFDGYLQSTRGQVHSEDAQILALPRNTTRPQFLLFPFLNNQNGLDTGFALANTSADLFGTAATSGTCTLNWYGSGPAAGTA